MIVELGGILFQAGDGISEGFTVSRLDGWRDGPDSKVGVEERPDSDGAFGIAEPFRASKVVTLEGRYAGESLEGAYEAMSRLSALASSSGQLELRVTDPEAIWVVNVIVQRGPSLPGGLYLPSFEFAFDMLQMDPRRYRLPVEDSTGLPVAGGGMSWPVSWPLSWGVAGDLGRVEFVNVGTASSWPVFMVWGGLPEGFTLAEVGTGREIRFDGPIPEGHYLLVNPRTGLALLDGVEDRSGMLSRSDWWSVSAGGSSSVQFSSNGGTSGVPRVDTSFASANW